MKNIFVVLIPSVRQKPATDSNPFVAKNQYLYFRGRCIWFDLVTINISTTRLQLTKIPFLFVENMLIQG